MGKLTLRFALAATILSSCSVAHAQDADLCAIDQNPSQFCGKMITVRGSTWHEQEGGGLKNDRCRTVLWWQTPEKSGIQVSFKLKRDESWQTFTHYDSMSWNLGSGNPLPGFAPTPESLPVLPPHYLVTATFHGLFACRRKQTPWFFLVLESVSDVKVEAN